MKALKALVISMGVLLVAGLALVGYGLYNNTHRPPASAPVAKAPVAQVGGEPIPLASSDPSPPAKHGYFSVELPVPTGTRLEQMAEANGLIVLRFSGQDGDRLVVLDPQSGEVSGTVTLVPQTAPSPRP